jgi:hypothetical protein
MAQKGRQEAKHIDELNGRGRWRKLAATYGVAQHLSVVLRSLQHFTRGKWGKPTAGVQMPHQGGRSAHWATIEAAKSLIRRYGADAEEEASRRAAEASANGDQQGVTVWLEVADLIQIGLSGVSPDEEFAFILATTDTDVLRAAALLIERLGDEAEDRAAERARELEIAGDRVGAAVYLALVNAIVELRRRPAPGESVH